MATLTFVVDDRELLARIDRMTDQLGTFVDELARDAAAALAQEGGQHAATLGEEWKVKDGPSPSEKLVEAPAWWWHFTAHGTATHGPTRGRFLRFEVDGETVWAQSVRGMSATDFDEKALTQARGHVEEILGRVLV